MTRGTQKPKPQWVKDFMKSYTASRSGTNAAQRYGFSQSPSLKPYTFEQRTGKLIKESTNDAN